MPLRRSRRIVYRIPIKPSNAPLMHVQMTLVSALTASAITPAITQQAVPITTRVIALRSRVVMGQE